MLRYIPFPLLLCGCTLQEELVSTPENLSHLSAMRLTWAPPNPTTKAYQIKGVVYTPQQHLEMESVTIASHYGKGDGFHGRYTSTGEKFSMHRLTGAHKTAHLPSIARVVNLENGKTIDVKLNDRGPFFPGRDLDLSWKAAQMLGFSHKGIAKVHVKILVPDTLALTENKNAMLKYIRSNPHSPQSAVFQRLAYQPVSVLAKGAPPRKLKDTPPPLRNLHLKTLNSPKDGPLIAVCNYPSQEASHPLVLRTAARPQLPHATRFSKPHQTYTHTGRLEQAKLQTSAQGSSKTLGLKGTPVNNARPSIQQFFVRIGVYTTLEQAKQASLRYKKLLKQHTLQAPAHAFKKNLRTRLSKQTFTPFAWVPKKAIYLLVGPFQESYQAREHIQWLDVHGLLGARIIQHAKA